MRPLLASLLLLSCAPSDREVQHALLDRGYDTLKLLGPAPECLPRRGSRWEARHPVFKRMDTGVVCCSVDHYECEVRLSPR